MLLNLPSMSPEMKMPCGQLDDCSLTLLILAPWSGTHDGSDMLLPTMEPMTTSMSLLIMAKAGLGFLKMSTLDLTISGKICTCTYVYYHRVGL